MNIKNNKRAQDSKNKIKNAICNMLQTVGHNQLSIKSICANAGVNRTTFYSHFDGVEDALYQICEEYIVKAYKIFLKTNIPYKTRIKNAIEIIIDKIDFFNYVFTNVHNLELKILEMVQTCYVGNDDFINNDQAKLSLAFIISGFIGVGKLYFNSQNSKIDSQQFADVLCSAINLSNPYFIIK